MFFSPIILYDFQQMYVLIKTTYGNFSFFKKTQKHKKKFYLYFLLLLLKGALINISIIIIIHNLIYAFFQNNRQGSCSLSIYLIFLISAERKKFYFFVKFFFQVLVSFFTLLFHNGILLIEKLRKSESREFAGHFLKKILSIGTYFFTFQNFEHSILNTLKERVITWLIIRMMLIQMINIAIL
ncbi:hypothetical protein BpHYR1_025779 [Brachionus plicatilis]|uniref:Transmembrane protein n=1 Tax=Brachionus plicatilis TaxID=10195 RepID=A0A3M7PGS1_BRAPC|nr:hypothetical protein BpHYR1_025779 [Brachionus plicatilis]